MGKLSLEQLNYLPMITFLKIQRAGTQIQVYWPPPTMFFHYSGLSPGLYNRICLFFCFLSITSTSIITSVHNYPLVSNQFKPPHSNPLPQRLSLGVKESFSEIMLWIITTITIIHWLSHSFIVFFSFFFFPPMIAQCRLIIKQEFLLFMYFTFFFTCVVIPGKKVFFILAFILHLFLHIQERSVEIPLLFHSIQ